MSFFRPKREYFKTIGSAEQYFTFRDQSELPSFDTICASVPHGQKWIDHTDLHLQPQEHTGQIPHLVWPAEVPEWRNVRPELVKSGAGESMGMHFSDIQQGQLGDGWFLAALVVVCQKNLLRSIILRSDEDKGVYEFQFFTWNPRVGFEPLRVCVDSRVGILPNQSHPCFCYSDDRGELWPSLVEKAFAKVILRKQGTSAGGFAAMNGGVTAIALSHLLAGPSQLFVIDRAPVADELYEELSRRWQTGEAVTVFFKESVPRREVKGPTGFGNVVTGERGLVAKHAYSIFNMQSAQYHNGARLHLVQIRNPYGGNARDDPNAEWHGDWSDGSALWHNHPEIASQVNFLRSDDGLFWMSFTDLARNIRGFNTCRPDVRFLEQHRYKPQAVAPPPPPPPVAPPTEPMHRPVPVRPDPVPIPPREFVVPPRQPSPPMYRPSNNWYKRKDYFVDPNQESALELYPATCFDAYDRIANRANGLDGQWQDNTELHLPRLKIDNRQPALRYPSDITQWATSNIRPILAADIPGNVIEGSMGSGWFTSALQIVAMSGRVPDLLGRVDHQHGIFEFKFWRWQPGVGFQRMRVCVDKRIPILPHVATPSFSHSEIPGELWPSLAEKAFAKAIESKRDSKGASTQGYEALTTQPPYMSLPEFPVCLAVAHLLGGTASLYHVTEPPPPKDLTDMLTEHITQGNHHILLRWKATDEASKYGLMVNRAYSLLDIKTIAQYKVSLAQLRHPHGPRPAQGTTWTGEWSQNSPHWTPDLAAAVGYEDAVRNGEFWMTIPDVAHFLATIEVCVIAPPDLYDKTMGYMYNSYAEPSNSKLIMPPPTPAQHVAPPPSTKDMQIVPVQKDTRAEEEARLLRAELNKERECRMRLQDQLFEMEQKPKEKEFVYVQVPTEQPPVAAPMPPPVAAAPPVVQQPQYVMEQPQYVMEQPQYVMEQPQYVMEQPQYVMEQPMPQVVYEYVQEPQPMPQQIIQPMPQQIIKQVPEQQIIYTTAPAEQVVYEYVQEPQPQYYAPLPQKSSHQLFGTSSSGLVSAAPQYTQEVVINDPLGYTPSYGALSGGYRSSGSGSSGLLSSYPSTTSYVAAAPSTTSYPSTSYLSSAPTARPSARFSQGAALLPTTGRTRFGSAGAPLQRPSITAYPSAGAAAAPAPRKIFY